jgi:hypothetical protein
LRAIGDEQVSFEYTSKPEPCSNKSRSFRGVARLPLPFYGGRFSLKYQRVHTSIVATAPGPASPAPIAAPLAEENSVDPIRSQHGAVVTRQYQVLCSSDPFSPSFSIQSQRRRLCRSKRGVGPSRLAHQSSSGDLTYLVEDLKNIQALMVTVVPKASPPGEDFFRFVKPTCWIESGAALPPSLLVECDLLNSHLESSPEPSWISLRLSCPDEYSILWRDSFGVIESPGTGSPGSPCVDRLVIKIPYALTPSPVPQPRPSILKPSAPVSVHQQSGLYCRHCESLLLQASEISGVLPLPSGLFDQVMHEYLCSETEPTMPLSMSDVTSPRGFISVGEIFFSVNPKDLMSCGALLNCSCKMAPSLLDVVGGSLGLKGLPQVGLTEHSNSISLVDASTCSIVCLRCLSVLGDGLIASDVDPSEHSPAESIHLSDLQDVRFLRADVQWSPSGREVSWIDQDLVARLSEPCTSEQVTASTLPPLLVPSCRSSRTPSFGLSIAMTSPPSSSASLIGMIRAAGPSPSSPSSHQTQDSPSAEAPVQVSERG